jgi:hypothetical protein
MAFDRAGVHDALREAGNSPGPIMCRNCASCGNRHHQVHRPGLTLCDGNSPSGPSRHNSRTGAGDPGAGTGRPDCPPADTDTTRQGYEQTTLTGPFKTIAHRREGTIACAPRGWSHPRRGRAAGNTVVSGSFAKGVASAARSRILFKLHRKELPVRTAPRLRDSGNMRSVETGSGEPHRSAVVKTPEPQVKSWVEQRS